MSEHFLIRTADNGTDLYWRPEGRGYTTQIAEAGVFSEQRAMNQHKVRPEKDEALRLDEVLAKRTYTPEIVAAMARHVFVIREGGILLQKAYLGLEAAKAVCDGRKGRVHSWTEHDSHGPFWRSDCGIYVIEKLDL